MKKVLFLLGMFTLFTTVTFAQARANANARAASPSGRILELDSITLKNQVNKNATTKTPNDAARPSNKDKTGNPGNVVTPPNPANGQAPVKKND